jgi:hypothetical protein
VKEKVYTKTINGIEVSCTVSQGNAEDQPNLQLIEIRTAVADYIKTEGCDCCRDSEPHKEALDKIAVLLDMDRYSDDSGVDYGKYVTSNPDQLSFDDLQGFI